MMRHIYKFTNKCHSQTTSSLILSTVKDWVVNAIYYVMYNIYICIYIYINLVSIIFIYLNHIFIYLHDFEITVIINNKTVSVNVSAIAFFKTASHTIHNVHINLKR